MKVVFAIPVHTSDIDAATARFAEWKDMGYATAALVDDTGEPENCDLIVRVGAYRGWPWAVNRLSDALSGAGWLISGGHDVAPDPNRRAADIAEECREWFKGTLGVMQPCGDAYGALVDRSACVSPWLGLAWRMAVPLHEGYQHWYADTDLALVAGALNRLWWRPDLVQYHAHFTRRGEQPPAHLAARHAEMKPAKELYESRAAIIR